MRVLVKGVSKSFGAMNEERVYEYVREVHFCWCHSGCINVSFGCG